MAKTQAAQGTFITSASVAANTDATVASDIDVRTSAVVMLQVKVTSGATAPTVAPTLRVLHSQDDTLYDADVNNGRFFEKFSFPIPAANATAYYNVPLDVTAASYLRPILKNEDVAQAVTLEGKYICTSF